MSEQFALENKEDFPAQKSVKTNTVYFSKHMLRIKMTAKDPKNLSNNFREMWSFVKGSQLSPKGFTEDQFERQPVDSFCQIHQEPLGIFKQMIFYMKALICMWQLKSKEK